MTDVRPSRSRMTLPSCGGQSLTLILGIGARHCPFCSGHNPSEPSHVLSVHPLRPEHMPINAPWLSSTCHIAQRYGAL
jgi:hypothetical protein